MSLTELTMESAAHPFLTIDYDTAVAIIFQSAPEGTPPPAPVTSGRPARRLRDAMEPIASHAVWSRHTNEVLSKLGLKLFTGYVWGKAAVLGEPPTEVVVSVFPDFEPGLITAAYEEARRQCGRAGMMAAREEATIESLAAVLDGADVTPVIRALRRGVEAADGTGLVLFSGLRSLGWPDDPVGHLWRACDLLRQHRGDGHTAACIAAGLGPVTMNVMTELWMGIPVGQLAVGQRGWPEEAVAAAVAELERRGLVADGALTTAGRRLRDDIEDRTDAMQQSIIDAVGADLDALTRQLDGWSDALIAAGAAPPDPAKRAAG
ncbi:MAG: SCO6745 family protein [Acidimicrobiia bacterium]